jgi:ABC-type dipeptide/oligopeptide/nickel transport system permease subunit
VSATTARRIALPRLFESPAATCGVAIILFWVIIAVAAPWIAPYSPTRSYTPMLSPFSHGRLGTYFWLGTDNLGRDILSRLIFGTRTVLTYAPLATACAYLTGVAAGLAAGYRRGWVDELLSRGSDLVLAFPALVLYIAIIGRFGSSGLNIILAVVLATSPGVMRIVRGVVLEERDRAYVAAARMRGESALYITVAEILPNVRGPLIVDLCIRLGYVTITIGTLGFLGLGLPPPTPDWGGMINETRQFAMVFPHMVIPPCLAVVSLVLGFNLFADGLRDIAGRR